MVSIFSDICIRAFSRSEVFAVSRCVLHVSAEIDELSIVADQWARECAERIVFARDVFDACVRAVKRDPADVDVFLVHAAGLAAGDFQIVSFAAQAWPAARRIVYGARLAPNQWLDLTVTAASVDELRRLLVDEPAEAFAPREHADGVTPVDFSGRTPVPPKPLTGGTPVPHEIAASTIGRTPQPEETASHSLAQHEIDVLFGVMPR